MQDADIVPKITTVKTYPKARTIGDTDGGKRIRHSIELMDELVRSYQEGIVSERR